jgi:hypothetical protein
MVVESAAGVELLLDVGLARRITGRAEVEISVGDQRWSRRKVLLLRHSPSPAELDRALASATKSHYDGVYFVVGTAGSTLTDAAERDPRVAYAAVDQGVVSFLGAIYRASDRDPDTVARPARVSWTRLAVLRLLALRPQEPLTQSAIANRIGVSHVAVGKQLPALDGLIERAPGGWQTPDRAACWDRFMADYPGPLGLASYFGATGEPAEQVVRVEQVVRGQLEEQLIVSGDFAADFYAPWRRPARIVGYVSAQPPLELHGFAVVRAADATVELRIPRDPTIQAMSRTWVPSSGGEGRRYSDPLIAAWDLSRSPGGDVGSAVAQLRDRVMRETLWS